MSTCQTQSMKGAILMTVEGLMAGSLGLESMEMAGTGRQVIRQRMKPIENASRFADTKNSLNAASLQNVLTRGKGLSAGKLGVHMT